jgi:hypothetical protein
VKDFKITSNKAALGALVFLAGLGLVLGTAWAQKAAPGDKGGVSTPKTITAPPTKGVQYVQVPDLIGKTEEVAKEELAKVGLKAGKVLFTTLEKGTPDTVVRQEPKATARVAKGSAVDLWILRARAFPKAKAPEKEPAKVTPEVVQKGKKVYMEFPETVKDVTIFDAKGNKLQHFNKGKRFDVTESVLKTKAGHVKVGYNLMPKGVVSKGGVPIDTYDTQIFFFGEYLMDKSKLFAETISKLYDTSTIENGEPTNDNLNAATNQKPLAPNKRYSGVVGGAEDPRDCLKITSAPGPAVIGNLIEIDVLSGDVVFAVFGPTLNQLFGTTKRYWIALESNVDIYIAMMTQGSSPTPYSIRISSNPIYDMYEPNNDESQPTNILINFPVNGGCLCPITNGLGTHRDTDWYEINLSHPIKIRITVENTLLPAPMKVKISLHSIRWIASSFAAQDGATLYKDLSTIYTNETLPPRLLIEVHTTLSITPCGIGIPPACYTTTGYGYRLMVSEIP